MNKLKVGLIGLGQICRDRHLPFYLRNKNVDLVGVCDINPEKMKGLEIPRFTDYKDLLEHDLDLVDIVTPPFDHVQQSLNCLKAGCNILIEKPFTFTLEECMAVLSFAKDQDLKVGVFHSSLFFPVMMDIHHYEKVKELGDLQLIRINYNVSIKNHVVCNDWILKMPFGALDEQIPHIAYILNNFMQVEKAEVIKNGINICSKMPDKHYTIVLDGSCVAVIDLFYGKDWAFDIELIGSEKKMFIDLLNQHYIISDLEEDVSKLSVLSHSFRSIKTRMKTLFRLARYKGIPFGHECIIESFVDSIINDVDPPISFQDISNVVGITEMINQASKRS